jgi:transposase
MAAPLVFDYLARLNIAPQSERAAPRSVPLGAGLFCGADGRLAATMLGRGDELRKRGIPRSAQIRFNADFWRSAVDCDALRDDQWERLKEFVPGGRKGKRGPRTDNRRFLNALLWMARSGARWRDLPGQLGDYETVKRRYYRWIEMGVLDQILAAFAREADLEWLMIDSTIVRAHQHAAGASRQKGGRMPRALAGLAGA